LTENGSPEKYAAIITDFFRVTLRCHSGHRSGYTIPLTKKQSTLADQLMESLKRGDEIQIKEVVEQLHQFSFSLLIPQPEPGADHPQPETRGLRWSCPVQCYLAVQAVRQDGTFISTSILAQKLAKLKYFCKSCALVQAKRMTEGTTPCGMLS
jgi:hypothetical protein